MAIKPNTNGHIAPEDVDGYELDCYSFKVPRNTEYLAAFFGALTTLQQAWVWDTNGDQEKAEEIATYWRGLLEEHTTEGCGAGEPEKDDTPYWDDETSIVGDGEGVKWGFTEIADWTVSAFLATSVHPAAGLFYKTVIPKGRIAFKSHDLGGLARILIDGIMAIEVDTTSVVEGVSEIIEIPIDFVQFAIDHSLTGIERLIEIVKVG